MTLLSGDEFYQGFTWTGGAGEIRVELALYGDGSASITFKVLLEHLYRLDGRHQRWSDGYGWIYIDKVEDAYLPWNPPQEEFSTSLVPIEALGAALIYEYFKVAASPVIQHPEEALDTMRDWGKAGWNETFDLLLQPHGFMIEAYEGLKLMLNEGHTTEPDAPNSRKNLDQKALSQLQDLIYGLQNVKLARQQQ